MRKALFAGATGLVTTLAIVGSKETGPELHADDWPAQEEQLTQRYYRSLSHFFFHLKGFLGGLKPTAEVYIMRPIPPTLRERILLVTAIANDCYL